MRVAAQKIVEKTLYPKSGTAPRFVKRTIKLCQKLARRRIPGRKLRASVNA